jgi:polyisoprenoid-binding protein YceI/mono/diheme cytochrome c family protein
MTPKPLLFFLLVPLAVQAEPRTWTLQKGTGRARFRVEAPLDAINGSSAGVSGTLSFDEASWASGTGRIRIDLTSFTTGLSLRDEDLRDQFFQVDRFPEATLTVARLERPSQGALVPGRDGEADAVGTLALHGRNQPVRIPMTLQLSETGGGRDLLVRGHFEVALSDHGIVRPARLFLKLGPVAQVSFEAVFHATAPAGAPPVALQAPTPQAPVTNAARSFPKVELAIAVARRPAKPKVTRTTSSWEFAFTSLEGRGERLFRDPAVGGEANALSCAACHGWNDERSGLLDPSGHVSSNSSLWNSARRRSFWRGFADSPEKATNLCVRRFMLRPGGADPTQLAELAAYLKAISPDVAPPHDFTPLILARKTAIDRPTRGDSKRGAVLAERFCGRCHAEGAMRPPLEVGLYEPDYLVARVRWIAPHDAKQMPPMPMDRLRDSELRDIVTYLVGADRDRIFQRKRAGAPRADRSGLRTGGLAAVSGRD